MNNNNDVITIWAKDTETGKYGYVEVHVLDIQQYYELQDKVMIVEDRKQPEPV